MKDTKSLWEAAVPRYPEFKNQVAIVTGSSRDIGRGIAVRLAREGMRVTINARTRETVEEVVRDLRDLGAEAIGVVGDVGLRNDARRLIDETLEAFGAIDVLVNNAANMKRTRLLDASEELIEAGIQTNILGPYLCSLYAAPVMREKGKGNIIHITSVGGQRAHFENTPYDTTKGAIDAMTRGMAVDLGEYGIRVNAVCPGGTPGFRYPPGSKGAQEPHMRNYPLRCMGVYLDMASAVAFLVSPEAEYITGHILTVDGGILAQLSPSNCQI